MIYQRSRARFLRGEISIKIIHTTADMVHKKREDRLRVQPVISVEATVIGCSPLVKTPADVFCITRCYSKGQELDGYGQWQQIRFSQFSSRIGISLWMDTLYLNHPPAQTSSLSGKPLRHEIRVWEITNSIYSQKPNLIEIFRQFVFTCDNSFLWWRSLLLAPPLTGGAGCGCDNGDIYPVGDPVCFQEGNAGAESSNSYLLYGYLLGRWMDYVVADVTNRTSERQYAQSHSYPKSAYSCQL